MEYITHFLQSAGYIGYIILFLTIFLESFPLTFFLPGDSLLFTTGFLASQGHLNLALLIGTLFVGSILGYMFSYAVGKHLRSVIFGERETFWFSKKHLIHTQNFYEKYGLKTIIIGRFVPVVRSFSPTLAGAVEMKYEKFIRYTLIGGALWTGGVTTAGFYLGKAVPQAHLYLTPIIIAIVIASILPSIIEYFYTRRQEKQKATQNNKTEQDVHISDTAEQTGLHE